MIRPIVLACVVWTAPIAADPLPSWTDAAAKARIIAFVDDVVATDSDRFVPVADRIAVFDNDGTLWSEQPAYFQLLFAIDRLVDMAKSDPSILSSDALRAAAQNDLEGLVATGRDGMMEVIGLTHSGLHVTAFQDAVKAWLNDARHPSTGLAYNEMVYQPMLELLRYLRDEEFTTYIVSGGGLHFMRAFAEDVYGIAPEQVIGSAGESRYDVVDGAPRIMKDPAIAFIDDGPGKPVGIDNRIGKRPILAVGNSDGDFEMLEWTTAGKGPRLAVIIHHTDLDREFAYDRESHIGRLERGLDEAETRDWLIVDMAEDWSKVWPKQPDRADP